MPRANDSRARQGHDDGPGIPPAEQARVFDLFYHGGRVGTGCEDGEGGDARRGMGLGLSLCRSILRAHGSDIVLRDAYPHGCVFSFALPAAELREEAPVGAKSMARSPLRYVSPASSSVSSKATRRSATRTRASSSATEKGFVR